MRIFPLLILCAFILFGCKDNKKPDSLNDKTREIKTITDKDLQEIIKDRNGKTLFLNVWATWCEPCVEEFPAIVQLDKNYKNKNIEIIGISVDLPSETYKIAPFLKKQGAEFVVYVADEKSSEKIINMLNPDWSGAIPATFIFDKSGKKQKFLLGAHTYEQMSSGIDSVMSL